ncbi:MAG: LacI family transcriptional regulator [Clostridium sp.]|nr:LacI family transcriptional regulator [Clostridium sp.]
MKKATLKEVAKQAGVSTATVSYVINGSRGVSDESRRKVEAAIHELSYYPNQLARNLKNGKHNTIGFIVPDIANIYFSAIIEEVETVLAINGINLIIANTKETPQNEVNQIRSLSNGLVDGLIIASTISDYSTISDIIPAKFPVVMVDRGICNCPADQVLVSSETAMFQGISELVSNGHTKIGYIAGLRHIYTTEQRIKEFKNALNTVGISPDDDLIQYTTAESSSAQELAYSLLNTGCTAIVAGNNIITMDLVNIALKNLLSNKSEFQILGYSYGEWYSWLPFLKTIEVPTRDVGRLAIRRLLERLESPDISSKEYILTCIYSYQVRNQSICEF